MKKKKPLTLFERLRVRGSWRLNKDCNILTSIAPPGIAVCRSRSPGLLNRGPGGMGAQPLLDMFSSLQVLTNWSGRQTPSGVTRAPSAGGGFPYHILSPTRLISNSIRGPEGPFCWVVAFSTTSPPTSLVPNSLTSCLHRVI